MDKSKSSRTRHRQNPTEFNHFSRTQGRIAKTLQRRLVSGYLYLIVKPIQEYFEGGLKSSFLFRLIIWVKWLKQKTIYLRSKVLTVAELCQYSSCGL
jgi:hypothetical protein